jgi:hypothetical protein
MMTFKNIINLFNHKSGSVIMEFALVVPILLFLLGASVEISNALYASQKAQTAVALAGSLVTDSDTINVTEIKNIAKLSGLIVKGVVTNTDNNAQSDYGVGVIIIQEMGGKKFKLYKQVYGNNTLLDFGFSNIQNSSQVASGGAVDNEFVNLNKLTINEDALINHYPLSNNAQIIITKVAIRYRFAVFQSISSSIFGSSTITLFEQTSPSTPRVYKFKFLPNGSTIP